MTLDEFIHILDEINGHTEHVYLHVQGEPLLHPDLIHFMDECNHRGLKVHVVTNGTLLKNYESTFFKHPALVQLSISIHAAQIKMNDKNYSIVKQLIEFSEFNNVSIFLRIWTDNDYTINELIQTLILPYKFISEGKRIRIKKNLFIDLDDEFEWQNLTQSFHSTEGKCHSGSKMMAILSNGEVTPCCLEANGIVNVGNINISSVEKVIKNERTFKIIKGN